MCDPIGQVTPRSFEGFIQLKPLSMYIVTADSVNSFKGRFDKCSSHLRFSTDVHDFCTMSEISQQALGLYKTAYLMMMIVVFEAAV